MLAAPLQRAAQTPVAQSNDDDTMRTRSLLNMAGTPAAEEAR